MGSLYVIIVIIRPSPEGYSSVIIMIIIIIRSSPAGYASVVIIIIIVIYPFQGGWSSAIIIIINFPSSSWLLSPLMSMMLPSGYFSSSFFC